MNINPEIRADEIKLFWVRNEWPDELDQLVVVWRPDGFLMASDLIHRPIGVEITIEHQSPYRVPIYKNPLFVSVFPVYVDGTYGVPTFITSSPPVTVHWTLEYEQSDTPIITLVFDCQDSLPVYVPPLRLIWEHADAQPVTLGESVSQYVTPGTQYRLQTEVVPMESGGLRLEPPLSAYFHYLRFDPITLPVGIGMPAHMMLRSLLQQLSSANSAEQVTITHQIEAQVQPMSAEERQTCLDQIIYFNGLDQRAYSLALTYLLPDDADVNVLETILGDSRIDEAAKGAILERIVSLFKSDPSDRPVRDLLRDIFVGTVSFELPLRLSLAGPLAADSQWDFIRLILKKDTLELDLRNALLRAWARPLIRQSGWETEQAILDKLLSIVKASIDSLGWGEIALRLTAAQQIAAWMEYRQLNPYRNLDSQDNLSDDDPQHQRECWAYRAAESIAGQDTFVQKLSWEDLLSLSGLAHSGNEAVARMFHMRREQLNAHTGLQIVAKTFEQTRTSNSEIVEWLVKQTANNANPLTLCEACIDALVVSPTGHHNSELLNGLANSLLLDTRTEISLHRYALRLISVHHLLESATHLAPIIWNDPDLREDAIQAFHSAPHPEVISQIIISARQHEGEPPFDLTRIIRVDYPELSPARRMLDALGRVKSLQDQGDRLKAELEDFIARNNLIVDLSDRLNSEMLEKVYDVLQSELRFVKTAKDMLVAKRKTQQNKYNGQMHGFESRREKLEVSQQYAEDNQKNLSLDFRKAEQTLKINEGTVKAWEIELETHRKERKNLNLSSESILEERDARQRLDKEINKLEVKVEKARSVVEDQKDILRNLRVQLGAEQQMFQEAELELQALENEEKQAKRLQMEADSALAREIEDTQRQVAQLTQAREELGEFAARVRVGEITEYPAANNALETSQKEWSKLVPDISADLKKRLAKQRSQLNEQVSYIRKRLKMLPDNNHPINR